MTTRFTAMAVSLGVCLVLGGCPLQQNRLSNQGGGNLVTFGLKVLNKNLTAATPDEWQVLTDRVSEALPQVNITLGDDEAQVISDFIQANSLNSLQDIEQVVTQVSNDPHNAGNLVIPESLVTLIESGVDINSIVQVQQ
ncbi:MAG: hypothetical protein U1D55_08765 [Phycisphaerae bacterium]